MFARWSRPSRLYLITGVVMALVGVLMLHAYLARVAAATERQGARVPVVVAAADITRGAALQAQDLRVVSIPPAYAPPAALRTIGQASGRVTLSDLSRGEAVTRTRLARVRAGPVASLVPEGLRAFAVPSSLPPGSVEPGDLVDVLATYSSGQPHTETVVTAVQILFVLGPGGSAPTVGDASPGGPADGGGPFGSLDTQAAGIAQPGTLILLVSPDQESRLAFARAFADLAIAVEPASATPPEAGS